MMRNRTWIIVAAAVFGLIQGCRATAPRETEPTPEIDPMLSVNTLIPAPEGFLERHIDSEEYPIPAYAKFLAGVKVCLDPGHGGDAHKRGYKRGPTGVREAEMNLRIAQYLSALLAEVGAEVLLTRDGDVEISLADRAAIANDWGADLFISLHHNAIGNKPHVNRTSVWYHNDVDYRPSNLDLARYLLQGLQDSLALPQITGVSLKSDNLMYDTGFGILRHADVTAALCESSFFTNPEEEQRLRDPEHNFLEAHGLFTGLAKYAAAGLPRVRLIEPEDGLVSADPEQVLVFELDDGLRSRKSWGADRQMIVSSTITVNIDDAPTAFEFTDDVEQYLLTITLPADLPPGEHAIEIQFQNMFKNSVLNPHFAIDVR